MASPCAVQGSNPWLVGKGGEEGKEEEVCVEGGRRDAAKVDAGVWREGVFGGVGDTRVVDGGHGWGG